MIPTNAIPLPVQSDFTGGCLLDHLFPAPSALRSPLPHSAPHSPRASCTGPPFRLPHSLVPPAARQTINQSVKEGSFGALYLLSHQAEGGRRERHGPRDPPICEIMFGLGLVQLISASASDQLLLIPTHLNPIRASLYFGRGGAEWRCVEVELGVIERIGLGCTSSRAGQDKVSAVAGWAGERSE